MIFIIIHMIFFILAFTLATIVDRGYNSTKRIIDRFFLSFLIPPVMLMYALVIFIDKFHQNENK
jgi:ABC-type molybdate transport system permease subunit